MLLVVVTLGALRLRLNSSLLALDVFLVLCQLIGCDGLITLIDLHVAVRSRLGLSLMPCRRVALRVVTVMDDTSVVLFVLRTGVVVGPAVAVIVVVRNLLVASPRWGRRSTTDGAPTEVLRVCVVAHYCLCVGGALELVCWGGERVGGGGLSSKFGAE